jgi:type I restriction enzyme, S subunit
MKYKRYSKYKDSGIEWIGEIPEGWEVNRLKFLKKGSLMYGANEIGELKSSTNIRYVRITDFDSNGDLRNANPKFLDYDIAKEFLLEDGDVLLARSGATVGKSFIYRKKWGKACFAGYLIKFRSNKNIFDHNFFYFYAQSKNYWNYVNSVRIQATIENVSADKYSNLPVIVPPIDEQEQIVEFLDKQRKQFNELIAKSKVQVTLLEEKKQATINQVVTKGLDPSVPMKDSGVEWIGEIPKHWEVNRLGYNVKFMSGFAFDSDKFTDDNNGINLVRGDNVTEGHIRWGEKTRKWLSMSEDLKKFVLQENDVLIGMDGSKVGKNFAIVTKTDLPALLVQRVARLRCLEHLTQKFVYYLIGNYAFSQYINSVKTNVAIPHMSPLDIKMFPIPVPSSIIEVNQITNFLQNKITQFDELIAKSKDQITLLEEKKQALITATVTGKIDVRGTIA